MNDQYPANEVLSGKDTKDLLITYGIPVVPESVALSIDDALQAAVEIGFPVVLKGLGASLTHKTERHLVHLNLHAVPAFRQAAETIVREAGDALEGFLIQPHLNGRREWVAGFFRDPQFGPVVMFGLGGIFAEALADVVFRLAPLTETDASGMLDDIRSNLLLDAFRGEAAVRRKQLTATLLGLSRMAEDHPEISEVDINPLITAPDGHVCAVDALIVKKMPGRIPKLRTPVAPAVVESFFFPESVAFIGASNTIAKWGNMLLTNAIGGGFSGRIYPVNARGGKIVGMQVFQSIEDIREKVDLAVVTIPAQQVADLIPPLRQHHICNVLLISSGFGEIGSAGKAAEQAFVDEAREAGIYIIGPNTMGICSPSATFYCTGIHVRPGPGATSVASQSGNIGNQILAFAEEQGLGIRVFAGSGNEAMITIEDFLEFFGTDEKTRIITLYVESLKNGRRFFDIARRVSSEKPVILLKGGQSGAGNRAAVSHTGALSSDARIFNAMCRQAGIIKVDETIELLDLAAAFDALPLPRGNRAAIITLGGGWGVVAADQCAKYGLQVPMLTPDIIERIDEILPPFWSRTNPIDMVGQLDNTLPLILLEEILKWEGCDTVISLGILGRRLVLRRFLDSIRKTDPAYPVENIKRKNEEYSDFESYFIRRSILLMEKYHKPIYGVSIVSGEDDRRIYPIRDSRCKGVYFPTPERAVKAFARMNQYRCFQACNSSSSGSHDLC